MAFQKVEYEFPDDQDKKPNIEVESSSAVEIDLSGKKPAESKPEPQSKRDTSDDGLEIEVVDDTPKADRGRKTSEPPSDVTDEELEEYSDKVKNRIKHFQQRLPRRKAGKRRQPSAKDKSLKRLLKSWYGREQRIKRHGWYKNQSAYA